MEKIIHFENIRIVDVKKIQKDVREKIFKENDDSLGGRAKNGKKHFKVKPTEYEPNQNLGLQLHDEIDITSLKANQNSTSPRFGPTPYLSLWLGHMQEGPIKDYPQPESFIQTPKPLHKHKPQHAPLGSIR